MAQEREYGPMWKKIKKRILYRYFWKSLDVRKYSTYWKNVTCPECLKHLEVVKIDKLNKFKE